MVVEPNQGRWPDLRETVAAGVFLVLLTQMEMDDVSAVIAEAPRMAGTAVQLADVLLQALKEISPGGGA